VAGPAGSTRKPPSHPGLLPPWSGRRVRPALAIASAIASGPLGAGGALGLFCPLGGFLRVLDVPLRFVRECALVVTGPLGAGGPLGPLGAFCRLSGVLLLLAFFTHGASSFCPLVGLTAGYRFGRNPGPAWCG